MDLRLYRDELPLAKMAWKRWGWIPWEEFQTLRERVQRLTGISELLPPSSDFGPLVGRAFYRSHDFEGDAYFYPCIAEDAAERLRGCGISIQTHATRIIPHKRTQRQYLEIMAPPVADIGSIVQPKYCSVCGGWSVRYGAIPRVIRKNSIPEGVAFFRMKQHCSYVLCTEAVKAAVEQLKLTGAVFVPVTVTDE